MRLDDDLLRYYFDELTYLRKTGQNFARHYPRVAGRLEMPNGESSDPHVERLIESFAFLTARIQRQINAEFPEVTSALLGVLYPQLVQPIPPMAIAQFEVDPRRGKLTTGHLISRHTSLFAQSEEGLTCRFRNCYDVTLWPVSVTEAALEPAARYDFLSSTPKIGAVLRIRLSAAGGSLADLSLSCLRFFLNGPSELTSAIYELLFTSTLGIALLGDGSADPVQLAPDAIQPVGFGGNEDVLPYPHHALPGYRLLQEHFNFPEKFLFFDMQQLDSGKADQNLDILFLLPQMPRSNLAIDSGLFLLGCTPVINLFAKTTEPIRLDHRQLEYRLVADIRRERTTEIHSIVKVSASANPQEATREYHPFYSFRHTNDSSGPQAFWTARRVPTEREDLPGTDVLLSFLDLNFKPSLPPDQIVFAHTLCTNRRLATELPDNARLQIEESAPVLGIRCLSKPSAPVYPPMAGKTLWQLISNLSLNHLSLTSDAHGLSALKEMLQLYSFSNRPSVQQQINGIRQMQCKRTTRRIGPDAWRGFCQGTEVTLAFDRTLYVGNSALLLASVLRHFLAMHASVNSFVQVVATRTQQEGEWKRWSPLAGNQQVL